MCLQLFFSRLLLAAATLATLLQGRHTHTCTSKGVLSRYPRPVVDSSVNCSLLLSLLCLCSALSLSALPLSCLSSPLHFILSLDTVILIYISTHTNIHTHKTFNHTHFTLTIFVFFLPFSSSNYSSSSPPLLKYISFNISIHPCINFTSKVHTIILLSLTVTQCEWTKYSSKYKSLPYISDIFLLEQLCHRKK